MPVKPKPGAVPYSQAMSSQHEHVPEQLLQKLDILATQLSQASTDLHSSAEVITQLKNENLHLRSELNQVKIAINRQAAYLAQVDSELDGLAQYGRRENVVFSNLAVAEGQDVATQIIGLCKEMDVNVEKTDFVDAHVLPGKAGTQKRYIARLHQRSKVKEIFSNRRKSKNISDNRKADLAINGAKGFGIQVNLTPKRAKLLAQVQDFCTNTDRDKMCWVDYNTGNILLRLEAGKRGTVIRSTRDLVEIDRNYIPSEWYFCSSQYFEVSESDYANVVSGAVPHFNHPGVSNFDPYTNPQHGYEQGQGEYHRNLRSGSKPYKPY